MWSLFQFRIRVCYYKGTTNPRRAVLVKELTVYYYKRAANSVLLELEQLTDLSKDEIIVTFSKKEDEQLIQYETLTRNS